MILFLISFFMKIGYTTFYIEANIVCAIIFLIMLIRSLRSVDRQIKQRVFDMVLVSFILYFFSDCYWILVLDDYLPKTWFSITFANTLNSVILSYIAYHWFLYVETSQDSSFLSVRRNRIRTQIPIFVFSGLILVLFIAVPDTMIVDLKQPSLLYYILFLIVPVFFVVLAAIKSLSRAGRKENYAVHGQYIAYGLFPLGVTFFGIIQTLWLSAPLFCFGCTITLLYVYMLSQDDMISQDPLTGLNNRAQLRHYVAREFSRSEAENTPYYVMMLDLDWFKQVNDRYGHAEGDRAIILAAKASCKALKTAQSAR